MKWRVRRSDGSDTVIAAERADAQGDLIFWRVARVSTGFVEVARFAPAGWLWFVALDLREPVEVSDFTLSPEFSPAVPNLGSEG